MANAKEIQGRMKSIQDTMKITNAMYMISSSKMQRAKKTLADTLPFFEDEQRAVGKLVASLDDLSSEFFGKNKPDDEKVRGYFVVTADKGLAGAYNHNVLKMAEEAIKGQKKYKLFVMGEIGRHYFMHRGIAIDEQFHYTVDNPTLYRARNIASLLIHQYLEGQLDEVYIIYTQMKNAFSMNASQFCLLPLEKEGLMEKNTQQEVYHGAVAFYPSLAEVLDHLAPNVVTGYIYGALVESFASEHNARMMAMQNATNNAKDMLKDLGMEYNRVRQAAITREITEVIAGAKAQKKKR